MIPYKLRGAEYTGVTLTDSAFRQQRDETIETYLQHPSTDEILRRFRDAAGIPSSVNCQPGWGPTLGQYLGAYAKLYRGTGDRRVYDKCMDVFHGWTECADREPKLLCRGTYLYEKLLGGLLDMYEYMGTEEVLPWIRRITEAAAAQFDREIPRDGLQDARMKGQIEWYTLPENLFRAWQLLGDPLYLDFAKEWLYPHVWDKLAKDDGSVGPRHAYSHVNSLSSAARAYIVT